MSLRQRTACQTDAVPQSAASQSPHEQCALARRTSSPHAAACTMRASAPCDGTAAGDKSRPRRIEPTDGTSAIDARLRRTGGVTNIRSGHLVPCVMTPRLCAENCKGLGHPKASARLRQL